MFHSNKVMDAYSLVCATALQDFHSISNPCSLCPRIPLLPRVPKGFPVLFDLSPATKVFLNSMSIMLYLFNGKCCVLTHFMENKGFAFL